MTNWLSGGRGAVVVVLVWTVGWGLGFGGLLELWDPSGDKLEVTDVWPTAMALPGFVGGLIFAGLLRLAEAGRSLDEVSLARVVTWGVVTGLVLAVLSIATGGPIPLPLTAPETFGVATALSAVAAVGSAVFFRLVARRPLAAGRAG